MKDGGRQWKGGGGGDGGESGRMGRRQCVKYDGVVRVERGGDSVKVGEMGGEMN